MLPGVGLHISRFNHWPNKATSMSIVFSRESGKRTGHYPKYGDLPGMKPYPHLNQFEGASPLTTKIIHLSTHPSCENVLHPPICPVRAHDFFGRSSVLASVHSVCRPLKVNRFIQSLPLSFICVRGDSSFRKELIRGRTGLMRQACVRLPHVYLPLELKVFMK